MFKAIRFHRFKRAATFGGPSSRLKGAYPFFFCLSELCRSYQMYPLQSLQGFLALERRPIKDLMNVGGANNLIIPLLARLPQDEGNLDAEYQDDLVTLLCSTWEKSQLAQSCDPKASPMNVL